MTAEPRCYRSRNSTVTGIDRGCGLRYICSAAVTRSTAGRGELDAHPTRQSAAPKNESVTQCRLYTLMALRRPLSPFQANQSALTPLRVCTCNFCVTKLTPSLINEVIAGSSKM
jgi:hypothetical protein